MPVIQPTRSKKGSKQTMTRIFPFWLTLLWIFPSVVHLILLKGRNDDVFVEFQDVNSEPHLFTSNKLPEDESGGFLPRYMASVGNGHVATTVYTDTVFMNGVYNGFKGESHRARIQSRNNLRVNPVEGEKSDTAFTLDVQRGFFLEEFKSSGFKMHLRTFVHRFYHTVIVNQLLIRKVNATGSISLSLESLLGPPTEDFHVDPEIKYESEYDAIYQCGRTREVEDPKYQREPRQVCTVSTLIPAEIIANSSETWTFFTAYDYTLRSASIDFDAVAELMTLGKHEEIFQSHVSQWELLWEEGRIDIEGNIPLAKVVNGCFYYILISLPITWSTNTAVAQFYGVSPGGLANGEHMMDYQGHSFWDTEIWIYPPVAYFFPEAALEALNYRLFHIDRARDNAQFTGWQGARFPWEMCFTGAEVTPDCCPMGKDYEIHNTADIAFAARQYIALSRDLAWLNQTQPGYTATGFELVLDIAHFWASRATLDTIGGHHDILHVKPPGMAVTDIKNSVYTNVMAGYAIFFAQYAECLLRGPAPAQRTKNLEQDNDEKVPQKWVEIAKSLKLPRDFDLNFHPVYEGYQPGEILKQADTILLGFPLMYAMEAETRKNDLLLYGNATSRYGSAMTWAMHVVGFLELGDLARAEEYFNRSYQPYVREPFKIWTGRPPPELGVVNFLTGMGGFLQAVISGFGGFKLRQESIVFTQPRLLPGTQKVTFVGINYLQNVLDVEINSDGISLTLKEASPKYALAVEFPNGTRTYFPPSRIITMPLSQGTFTSFQITGGRSKCPLPYDKINEKYTFVAQNGVSSAYIHILFLLQPIAFIFWSDKVF